LERVLAAYRSRAEMLRDRWIDAESVSSLLADVNPNLRCWLKAHYSVTDLKELLRAVIGLEPEELQQRRGEPDPGQVRVPRGSTAAYQEWLLSSLVFWSQTEDGGLKAL